MWPIVVFAGGLAAGVIVTVLFVLWLGSVNDWRNEGNWWSANNRDGA